MIYFHHFCGYDCFDAHIFKVKNFQDYLTSAWILQTESHFIIVFLPAMVGKLSDKLRVGKRVELKSYSQNVH